MRNSRLVYRFVFMFAALLFAMSFAASAAEVPRMSVDELKSRLGEVDLVILDVRQDSDLSDKQIVGSVQVNPGAVNQWADNYSKDKVIVLYCT